MPAHRPADPGRADRRATAALAAGATVVVAIVGGWAGFGGAALATRFGVGAPAEVSVSPTASPEPSVTPSPSPVPLPPPGQVPAIDVAAKLLPSTVTISVRTSNGTGTGSGFVLDAQGHVMTNNHVVSGADDRAPIVLTFDDGRRFEADIVGRSRSYDLAVLKVDSDAPIVPVELGDSNAVQIGQLAIAVGSPLGLGGTVTEGIVSAKDRPVVVGGNSQGEGASAFINAVQTDAPINPGNSGGPLVDAQGRVIGVNSAILSLGSTANRPAGNIGVGFAIPISQAQEIAELLIEDGRASYPTLGAGLANTGATAADSAGAEVSSVADNGPAKRGGLRKGDVITSVQGRRVASLVECIVAIRSHRPGDTVSIGYTRDGDEAKASVKLSGKVG